MLKHLSVAVFLPAGMVALCLYHWRLWRRDYALVIQMKDRSPVPVLVRKPQVSVLVAAWNEGQQIEAHIQSFLALSYPHIELLLCAGGDDDTYERAVCFAGPTLKVLRQVPGEGKQRAIAHCLEHAQGEIIYLTDADCRYDDEALVRLIAPLLNDNYPAATGVSRPLDHQMDALLPRHLWAIDTMSNAGRPADSDGILGRNAALTRTVIEQIGGFDYAAPTGTDYHLAKRLLRAGMHIRFVPESCVPTVYPQTFASYRRRQSRWLRNVLLYGPIYGAQREVAATRRTLGIGLGMVVLPIIGLVSLPLLPIWLLLVFHGMLARLRYAGFTALRYSRTTPRRLFMALPILTLADFIVWALPVFDLLNPRRRQRW